MASMHNLICESVAAVIDAMIWNPESTVVRKEPVRLENDTAEICIVSQEGEQRETGDVFGGAKLREYDVRITFLRSGKMQLQTNVLTNPEMLELIRAELHDEDGVSLIGVPEVWDITFPPVASIKLGSVTSGQDQTTLVATYRTCEAI